MSKKIIALKDIPVWPDMSTIVPKSTADAPSENYAVREALNKKVSVIKADITKLEVDAIVNAGTNSLLGGGGIHSAIHKEAGPELRKEVRKHDGCEMGDAIITKGYLLPAKYVIHTIGPKVENAEMLTMCYKRCLELAEENNIKTIAFPCISTGLHAYPQEPATDVAVKTVRTHLEENSKTGLDRIIFCVLVPDHLAIYVKKLLEYFPVNK